MYSTRVLELVQIFCIYSFVVFGLGEIITKPFTRGKGIKYWICTNLVVGNFYMINMTFLLAYLKCLHRSVIIVTFFLGACLIRYIADKQNLVRYWKEKYEILVRLLKGEYGTRLIIQQVRNNMWSRLKNGGVYLLKGRLLEGGLLLLALAINVYYFSYQALNIVSYAAPDVEVHLYWIQSLVGGELFPAGVYPFGMHCLSATLAIAFDISAVTIARMLGVVTSFYIMLVCYLLVKYLCKLKYAPIVGFMIFSIANITVSSTYLRYSAMIPQEYAMIFLAPLMYYLYLYLREKKYQELVLFGMAFSLTIAIHFYITAIAVFFFLAIGMVYLYRMIKRKMLLPIIVCGILSTVVAIFPLVIGLCMGYKLEQSFVYGASVIMNDENMYLQSTGNTMQEEDESEEDETDDEEDVKEKRTWNQVLDDCREVFEDYVFVNIRGLWICIVPTMLVLIWWIVSFVKKNVSNQNMEFLSQMTYLLLLLLEVIFYKFDLPIIIEPKRMGIFIAYMIPLLVAIPLEVMYILLHKCNWRKGICNGTAIVVLVVSGIHIVTSGNIKELSEIYYFQTSGAMRVACDIIRNYEKETWTIVSAVNETAITRNAGYHYEMYDFLMELENYESDTELYIPTEYIFFYVEKMPIQKYGWRFGIEDEILKSRQRINRGAAIQKLGDEYKKAEEYYKYCRMQLMSRMYYWAEIYRQYFSDEMSIFYEDDEIVVYRLKQNVYALNNLAIDYRKELMDE